MSSAIILIQQSGAPAGVAGKSRDDLALYSGANPIQISSTDGTAGTVAWALIDKPPSSTAAIANPSIASTTFNPDVPGSYFIQLTVDGGGSPGQIQRLVAAVQIALPVWVTGTLDAPKLRIPAKGETIEFNVQSSPASGANTRGWAQEMDEWFRSISQYAFGVAIQSASTPVTGTGYSTFFTLNFGSGFTIVDGGNGVLNISTSGGGGGGGALSPANYTVALPGGPFSVLDVEASFFAPSGSNIYNSAGNANFEASGSNAQLVVHAGHHQKLFHNPGILPDPNTTLGYAATINTGSNPHTVTFTDLAGTQIATSDGRVINPGVLGAGPQINIGAPASPRLIDWTINPTSLQPEATQIIAVAASVNVEGLIVDVSPGHPTGAQNLAYSASGWRWSNGQTTPPLAAPGILRLFHSNGVDYVDVYQRVATPSTGTDSWTISAPSPTLQRVGRALYWVNGSTSEWGFLLNSERRFIDARQTGFLGDIELQPVALARIDQLGADLQFQAGVVFDHRRTVAVSSLADMYYDSFGLVGTGSSVPNDAVSIEGGSCWISGRRYTLKGSLAINTISGIGSAGKKIIWAEVGADGKSISLKAAAATDPINGLQTALLNGFDTQPPFAKDSAGGTPRKRCPLWYGNYDGTNLLGAGRVDLRRDVAYFGSWSVGTRSFYAYTSLDGSPTQQPLSRTAVPTPAGGLGTEFESIAAALAWHAVLTAGSLAGTVNNLLDSGGRGENYPCCLNIIKDTFETYPFTIWNNIEIRGGGRPNVRLMARATAFGTSEPGYFWIGSDSLVYGSGGGNQLVYNVKITGCNWVVDNPVGDGASNAECIRVNAPYWLDSAFPTIAPQASCQHVTIDDNRFFARVSAPTTSFAGIRFYAEAGPGGPGTHAGTYHIISIRKNNLGLSYGTTGSSNTTLGVGIGGIFTAPINGELSQQIEILDNTIRAGQFGIRLGEGNWGVDRTIIRDNFIGVTQSTGTLISFRDSSDWEVSRNTGTTSTSGGTGIFMFGSCPNGRMFANRLTGPSSATPTGSAITYSSCSDIRVYDNTLVGWLYGITASASVIRGSFKNNKLVEGGTSDSCSFGVNFPVTINDCEFVGNVISGYRVGLILGATGNVTRLSVKNNTIAGQSISAVTGVSEFSGKGILIAMQSILGTDQAIEIQGNTIRDIVTSDTLSHDLFSTPTGGIVVRAIDNASKALSGLTIEGNQIHCSNSISPGSALINTLGCWGIWTNASLSAGSVCNNTINSDGLQINCNDAGGTGDGGIRVGCGSSPLSSSTFAITSAIINGNTITWTSGSVSASQAASAGVRIFGDQLNTKVTNNQMLLNSTMNTDATSCGRLHGVVVDTNGSRIASNIEVSNNRISSEGYMATPLGTGGVPVWIRFSSNSCSINNNKISGSWHHNINTSVGLTENLKWAFIAVGIDGANTTNDCTINGNTIIVPDIPVAAGWNMLCGIRVGLSTGSGSNLQINNNLLDVNLYSTDLAGEGSGALDSGAIQVSGNGVSCEFVQIMNNRVFRLDPRGARTATAISNRGWCSAQVIGNDTNSSPTPFPAVRDLLEVNVGGMPHSARWSLNRAGTPSSVGRIDLDPTSYLADPGGGTNWDGSTFS